MQTDNVQVCFLIDANCMKALEPTKIIHSEGGGPYVNKTRLSCCVVGPINCISKGIATSCNRVAVRNFASSKLASHHLGIEKSVKNVSSEEIFQAMYTHDLNEPELVVTSAMLKCGEVSHEDRTFMEIFDKETSKKNDPYILLFPFRDANLMLPNKKNQTN